jgi:hypothetical protein
LTYEDWCTNKYNFEKLEIEKEELHCRNCDFTSRNLSDFAGSNAASTPCTCCPPKISFYCKKVACKSKGGFSDVKPGQAHMQTRDFFPTINDQRFISAARSAGIASTASTSTSQSTASSQSNECDELLNQGEKLLKKSRFSPALRCFSLAIDKILLGKSLDKMTKSQRVKLIQLYTRRSECYMTMAERFNKLRYANLASDDAFFILKNPILLADVQSDESLVKQIALVNKKSEDFIFNRKTPKTTQSENSSNTTNQRRNNNNRRTRRNRPQRAANTENKENQENEQASAVNEEEFCPLLAYTCSKIRESNLAINALTEDDQCPICFMQWDNFVDPSIAVILPCSHACKKYFIEYIYIYELSYTGRPRI